jgi:A/G-specific adenine glycosylase
MNFSRKLISWYHENKRDLPWRRTKDPYLIWLSEVIMQQTRIDQGTPYYLNFVDRFPAVNDLAAADEQEVLKLWQGLGYYSRARNLHAAARAIMIEHAGKFPRTYAGIRNLKGIGDYTAAAIASISFNLPHAVMDGNVIRFLSRLTGIAESVDLPGTKKKIHSIATEKMDLRNPGDYNQAMMEFGAILCTPANPGCVHCPFKNTCNAFSNNMVDQIPARKSKANLRHRFIHYLVLTVSHQGTEYLYLNKRTGDDIWKNLYDFPSLERPFENTGHRLENHEISILFNPAAPQFQEATGPYVQVLTHQKLHAWFYRFHSAKLTELPYTLVALGEIRNYPVPKLVQQYLLESRLVTE